LKETLGTITREAAEVVSEDKDTELFKEASTYRTALFSEGSIYKRVAYPLLNAKNEKTTSACMTVISSDSKNKERLCCLFQGVGPGNSKRNQPDIQGRTQFILHIENNGKSF